MLGRTSPGRGPVELIPISGGTGNALGAKLVASGQVQGPVSGDITELGFYFQGPPPASTLFYGAASTGYPASFPSGAASCSAKCRVAPFASFTLGLYAEGVGHIADIVWAAGSLTGVITWDNPSYTLPAGTAFYLSTPSVADLRIAQVSVILIGDLTA